MSFAQPLLLTRYEAAELLGISYGYLDRLIRTGEIPSVKLGRRRKIPRTAVEKIASSGSRKSSTFGSASGA